MKDFDEPVSLALTGLFLGGEKCMVIQGKPGDVIREKKGERKKAMVVVAVTAAYSGAEGGGEIECTTRIGC
ncbi:hypothetical protein L2E82_16841 [Cichorium intybus]|uniref:Uncharacterized protein n=1 Tax=Cichorium intybus TaxID=13427 RepID=A0ACB9F6M8_CICIN|nr:hypothetical protein L2E82_16841 [Cichorium intybus]